MASGRRWVRIALAAGFALVLLTLPRLADVGHAQSVVIYSLRGLGFGTLSPGLNVSVNPASGSGRAELEIVGTGRFTMALDLPAEMVSAGGHRLPIAFGATDGLLTLRGGGGKTSTFDPRAPLDLTLTGGGSGGSGAFVYLGGTAKPPRDQAPGEYSAVITVRISNPAT